MELYLYSPIFSFTADEEILPKLHEATQDDTEEVVMRVNSPGGSVAAGWGIAAKMKEIKTPVTAKVDGLAASMATVILMFADKVEALDVSQIMIHRASGPTGDEEERNLLERVNKHLKDKLKTKIDQSKFKEITGYTIDQLFDTSKERLNIWLTAQQAKQIGLVDSVRKVDSQAVQSLENRIAALNEETTGKTVFPKNDDVPETNQNLNHMDLATLKSQYPQVFESAKAEGRKEGHEQGVNQERERVKSLLTYIDADQKDVCEKIKNGDELQPSTREDYTRKLNAKAMQGGMKNDSPEGVTQPNSDEGQSDEEKEVQDFWESAVEPELNEKQ